MSIPTNEEQNTALIYQKLETIAENLERNNREARDGIERLRGEVKEAFASVLKRMDDHEGRLRELERTTGQLSARLAMTQIVQTTFTTIASAIAAVVGAVLK